MNELKSKRVTEGREKAGARSLWRANGMKESHFGKPIIAIANSFTQFVPGHGHLKDVGQNVKAIFENAGFFAAEFNTIAIDDGIAMSHSGMLYSLPSRDLIADSVEYMCNAHCVDALFCISNCDKITPGMLMAAMRLNIPTILVSGGPMEAGSVNDKSIDLTDAITEGGKDTIDPVYLRELELNACPTCGSCSGMFTANSMNCLTEALGLALPGNGTLLATHKFRLQLFEDAAKELLKVTNEYYFRGNRSVLPRSIATREAFLNAMALDIAMGGSSNTILHLLAIANEANVELSMQDVNELSKKVPVLCKVSPSSQYHIEDVHKAGGVMAIMHELDKNNLINSNISRVDGKTLKETINEYNIISGQKHAIYYSAPGNYHNLKFASQGNMFEDLDNDRVNGCIRSIENAYMKDGGLAVLYGNIAGNGCIVKTVGVDKSIFYFKGRAKVFHSQEDACDAILNNRIVAGDVVIIIYEGPAGGPGMQEMLFPTSYLKSKNLDKVCALITDGRFSGGTSGLSIGHVSPEAAAGGEIALLKDGDLIEINIEQRAINALISTTELKSRRELEVKKGDIAFNPERKRNIPKSLQIYSKHVSSADKGAIRIL